MKKLTVSLLVLSFVLFIAVPGFSYTAYFAVDNTLDFDRLDGFDIFTNIANPLSSLSLTINYQATGGAVPNDLVIPPSTTIKFWDIFLTNYGVTGEKAIEANLVSGMVLSLTASSSFAVTGIDLLSNEAANGFYGASNYIITQSSYQDGVLYTASAVPIPAAVWLLGSGLVGLVALRRRMKK